MLKHYDDRGPADLDGIFASDFESDWHMQGGERAALIYLLQRFRPKISIEIGTFLGGSLRPISTYSDKVYTFDIDPNQHRVAPQFPSVEFVTGDTADTLRPVIESIVAAGEEIGFILIDGSHETEGVRKDVEACLSYVPRRTPCVIVMHDSSNPKVRAGLLAANWGASPYVQSLDLDFVPGALYDRADIKDQIWGGLAVALLTPKSRLGPLNVQANFRYSLEKLRVVASPGGE